MTGLFTTSLEKACEHFLWYHVARGPRRQLIKRSDHAVGIGLRYFLYLSLTELQSCKYNMSGLVFDYCYRLLQ